MNLASCDFDVNALLSELVNTLRLTHEHDLQLLSVGVVVDVLGKRLVDGVALDGNVDGNSRLQVDDVGLEGLHLSFEVSHGLEELEGGSVSGVAFLFKLDDVTGGSLHFFLEHFFVVKQTLILVLERVVFLHK